MKLLFCKQCNDVFRLKSKVSVCDCGETFGKYNEDGDTATVSSSPRTAVVGIYNTFWRDVIYSRPVAEGKIFVFDEDYHKLTYVDSVEDERLR